MKKLTHSPAVSFPATDQPRCRQIGVRLTDAELRRLERLRMNPKEPVAAVVRRLIAALPAVVCVLALAAPAHAVKAWLVRQSVSGATRLCIYRDYASREHARSIPAHHHCPMTSEVER